MRKLPPFSALKAFEAAARNLSFTAAGKELGISQSAVSHQVRQLEERFDTGLFVRTPRSLSLTPAGEGLLAELSEVLDRLEDVASDMTAEAVESLKVKATPTFAARWLLPRLEKFKEDCGLSLVVSTGLPPTDFARGDHDVEIHWGAEPVEGVVVEPFMATPKICVCAPEVAKRLRQKGLTGLNDEVLLRDETDDCWEEWLRDAAAPPVDFISGPAFAYCDLAISAAERGQGVALSYRALIERDLTDQRLVQVFPHETKAKVIYSVAYPRSRRHSRKIIAFRDWVFAEMAADAEAARAGLDATLVSVG